MPQQVRAVVARAKGAPVTVGTVVVPGPGPGEAVVALQACRVRDLESVVSERAALDGVEEALGRVERGEVLRSVVVL